MPSPFTRDQLSPAMQARYGMDRRPVGRVVGIVILGVAAVAILIGVTIAVTRQDDASKLISWSIVAPDRTDITYQYTPDATLPVHCVLRAQDEDRNDVGYATVVHDASSDTTPVITTFALRTLTASYAAELLGCAAGTDPRVPPPQFPPGIAAPAQPWTPSE